MEQDRALRVLEFTKIRERLAAHALTDMGKEKCLALVPYDDLSEVRRALDETEEHPNAALTGRDEIWMGYTAALALEMYLAGARDGGRVYHAFVTGELPGGAIRERKGEDHHARTDP